MNQRNTFFGRRTLAYAVLASLGIMPFAQAGETVCPVLADNSIESHPLERTNNAGQSGRLRFKGRHNMPLITFDLSRIPKDAVVTSAFVRATFTDPKVKLNQVGYSTVPTAWAEGKGGSNDPAASCFRWPGGEGKHWGDAGARIVEVVFGNGGNVTGYLFARQNGTKIEFDLPPRVVEAMRVDQPGGLLLMDESGWWDQNVRNIPIYSHEHRHAAELHVQWAQTTDTVAPSAPKVTVLRRKLGDGELLIEITCGGNNGDKGLALGYDMRLLEDQPVTDANWSRAKPFPRYRIPRPKQAGEKLRVWLIGLDPNKSASIGLVAYDESGNRSPVGASPLSDVPGPSAPPRLVHTPIPVTKGTPLLVDKSLKVWAVDELTEINPINGKTLTSSGYRKTDIQNGNHVWNGDRKMVQLFAVRGETVAFRVAMENVTGSPIRGLRLTLHTLKATRGKGSIDSDQIQVRRDWYVKVKGDWFATLLPIAKEKNQGKLDIPSTGREQNLSDQTIQTALVEITVPKNSAAGIYKGDIKLQGPDIATNIPVLLKVFDVEMPDKLSFRIELNSYGSKTKDVFHANHRLAHEYRLGYNTCPYSAGGGKSVPFIPEVVGKGADAKIADWATWDEWMGPLLDGSLFADLPRGTTPIPHFYLPFYENYPTPIRGQYMGGKLHRESYLKVTGRGWNRDKWIGYVTEHDGDVIDGFSDTWKHGAAKIANEYRQHFEDKGWTKTQFQIFANNKFYKSDNPTSLWVLDEPSYGRSFRALGFLYRTFAKPFEGSTVDVIERADVSRPQWQGDRLDGASGLTVVSSAIYEYPELIQRRMIEHDATYWFYGGSPGTDVDMSQLVALYLKNWATGCDGGLAYWTSFHGNGWGDTDPLACVVMGKRGYTSLAVPTDRVAAQRRAQQDIELLNLLSQRKGWSRRRVARALAAAISLKSETVATSADDPGTTRFKNIDAVALANIRLAVIRMLADN